jgi:hypothetical protein
VDGRGRLHPFGFRMTHNNTRAQMRHEAARVLREVAERMDCQSARNALEECANQIEAAAAELERAIGSAVQNGVPARRVAKATQRPAD